MKEVLKSQAGSFTESELARYVWLSDYERTWQLFTAEAREMAATPYETAEVARAVSGEIVREWLEELRAADEANAYPALQLAQAARA